MARDRIETAEVHDFYELSWRLNTVEQTQIVLCRGNSSGGSDLSWLQADGEPLSQQSLKQSLEAGACGQVATEGDGHMMFPVRTVLAIKVPNAARVSCGAVGGRAVCVLCCRGQGSW